MKYLLPLLFGLIFLSCSDKNEALTSDRDDTYFFGQIAGDSYDVKNDRITDKYIKTIQELPIYKFVFQHSIYEPTISPEKSSIVLAVDILDPAPGKNYNFRKGTSQDNDGLIGISCETVMKADLNSPDYKRNYIPNINREKIVATIEKVDFTILDNGVKIVEGTIKGTLYNAFDNRDSIKMDVHFRTKYYENEK
ncbi:DUF5025 domain-containing protein [Sphingobacterium sp. UBA5670]|uniref:DUF5025 domain-containing protein n=1 Tax=Sphingobacterium sp. UBA5670 TaxID=1947502 RepID=UPI0025F76E7D|nr:DUF5025 domain-containing protein [Sphingobacterium sp. UBA5670]